MRVAMYYNNRDVRIEEMPVPPVGPGEVLIKVMASGICGSDVMEWYRIKKAPLVLGHEITGVIEKTVGDRVFAAHHVPCNTCKYCLNGQHTVCETLHTTNFNPGGFAEYILVPQLNVDRGMLILPEEVSFVEGTFIEPLACVLRGQRMAEMKPGQTVMILGAGLSGMLHLLAARTVGATRVIVTDINQQRLETARSLGADLVISSKEDVVAGLKKINAQKLADVVIVCTGAMSAFQQALQCVDRAGTLLFFAPTEPGVTLPVPVNDFWRQSIKILHSYGSSPLDAAIALELLRAKMIPVQKMITHTLAMSETPLGFKLAAEAKECLKVIIEPQR